MKLPNQRLLYLLLPLLAGVALIVFGEALSDLWKEDVKALFQQNKWMLLAFVLLLAVVAYFLDREKRSEKFVSEAADTEQYETAFRDLRSELIGQYQTRLLNKTTDRLPINLAARPTQLGTSKTRAKLYFSQTTIESEDIASEIGKILDTVQRLLIIGNPGAGKTTIVLYAALNLLRDEKNLRLPLLLNLATWHSDQDFSEWYAENIAQSYNLNPIFAKALIQRNVLVPFFDGFDEVAEAHRVSCLDKMKTYFSDHRSRQLVVCSRKKEYVKTKADAPVYYEIEIQPLSLVQIKKTLRDNAEHQAADHALLQALEQDEWLCQAVETPFYLNTASFLFGKGEKTWEDFGFKGKDTKKRKDEIVERFVMEQVPDQRDRRFLHFLASRMEAEIFLVFELLKMQPRWSKSVWRYRLIFILLSGLLWGVPFGLVLRLIITLSNDNLFSNMFTELSGRLGISIGVVGLSVGSVLGLSIGLILGLANNRISTSEVQIWSWQEFKKTWKEVLIYTIAAGFLLGLLAALSHSIIYGLVLGIIGGLGYGLMVLKSQGTLVSYLLYIPSPYQRFLNTLRLGFWNTFIVILIVAIIGVGRAIFVEEWTIVDGIKFLQTKLFWYQALVLTLIALLLPLIESGLVEHFTLRLVLYLEGKMPLRVVTFMDRMSDQHIFEDNRRTIKGKKTRGATWRFRHKILQDYFAKMGMQND